MIPEEETECIAYQPCKLLSNLAIFNFHFLMVKNVLDILNKKPPQFQCTLILIRKTLIKCGLYFVWLWDEYVYNAKLLCDIFFSKNVILDNFTQQSKRMFSAQTNVKSHDILSLFRNKAIILVFPLTRVSADYLLYETLRVWY